jgi:succinoglycan biosynthesis protein ExoV
VILYRWQGAFPNFGDELNTLLWPRLLPGFFDDNPSARFLGIGSVLDRRHPEGVVKVVAGSGYGGYEAKAVLDRTWTVHWVRGPRTAAALGLPPALALGDPAVLAPAAAGMAPASGTETGFIPHFESAARGAWQKAAAWAGVRLIDPREPPEDVLRAIAGCKLLLSEALHGVIVADAMRVPWVAVRPIARVHRAKWLDWSESMSLRPRFSALPASTLREWARASRLSAFHAARQWMDADPDILTLGGDEWLAERAARALADAAAAEPQLSLDVALDRCQARMLAATEALRTAPVAGARPAAARRQARSYLRGEPESAYHIPVTG